MAWAVFVGASSGPIAQSAALAIALGFVFFTLLAVTGILLVRAPWARWLAAATLAAGAVTGAAIGLGPLGWIAVAVSLGGVTALVGPWLDVWLRGRPAADTIGWQPPVLLLATVGLIPLVGYTSPDGLALVHGLLAGLGLFFVWGYARAELWGLWGLRLAVLPLTALAVVATPGPGSLVLLIAGVGIAALAWSPPVRAAIGSPGPVLPAPGPPRRSPS